MSTLTATTTSKMTASSTTTSSSTASCTTAVPGKYGFVPPDACNANYPYNPSFGAAVAFAVIFGLVFVAHLAQAVRFRKKYCWVIIVAASWEFASFILRAIGAHNQQQLTIVIVFTLLFLLAPLWINAFVYMTLARMVHCFLPEKKVYRYKATWLTKIWVTLDIFSFIVQAVGGSLLSGQPPANVAKLGRNIYMTGIGIQELFILLFLVLAYRFHVRMNELDREGKLDRGIKWRWLMYTIYGVLLMITVRIIYRLLEFSRGASLNNPTVTHEVYSYVLDGVPMFIACLLLNICHPGTVLQGPDSEFPKLTRKEKKALKQKKKEEKRRKKEEKHELKRAKKEGRPPVLPQYSSQGGAFDVRSAGSEELKAPTSATNMV